MSIRHRCCYCSQFLGSGFRLEGFLLEYCQRLGLQPSCRQAHCRPEQQSSTKALCERLWLVAQQEPRQRLRSRLSSLTVGSASLAGRTLAGRVERGARGGGSSSRNGHRTPGLRDSPCRSSRISRRLPAPYTRFRPYDFLQAKRKNLSRSGFDASTIPPW